LGIAILQAMDGAGRAHLLEELLIDGCDASSVAALADAVTPLTGLVKLRAKLFYSPGPVLDALGGQAPLTRLTSLSLSGTCFRGWGVHLSSALARMPALESLDLNGCELGGPLLSDHLHTLLPLSTTTLRSLSLLGFDYRLRTPALCAFVNPLVAPDVAREPADRLQNAMRNLMSISAKLEGGPFKDQVVREMREYMLDLQFVDKLDSLPNLIAFDNGVWDLDAGGFREATPDDLICKSVGYSYTERDAPGAEAAVREYWEVMHPDVDQRAYVLRTFSRQLYGDRGHELFHVHSGHLASASNGKTGFFEAFQAAAGKYVCKFGVEYLTTKQRADPGKPMPEFARWKGARVLYCSEPTTTFSTLAS
jgi:hypothetical protein